MIISVLDFKLFLDSEPHLNRCRINEQPFYN